MTQAREFPALYRGRNAAAVDRYLLPALLNRSQLKLCVIPQFRLKDGALVGGSIHPGLLLTRRCRLQPATLRREVDRRGLALLLFYQTALRALDLQKRLVARNAYPRFSLAAPADVLVDEGMPDRLHAWVRRAGLNPDQIDIEIPTNAVLELGNAQVGGVAEHLLDRGFRTTFDEFGPAHPMAGVLPAGNRVRVRIGRHPWLSGRGPWVGISPRELLAHSGCMADQAIITGTGTAASFVSGRSAVALDSPPVGESRLWSLRDYLWARTETAM